MEVLPRENVYGHLQRLDWLRGHLQPEDRVVEFGCGTGRLITLPLRASGYDVVGVDLDQRSIDHGRGLLREAGLDSAALQAVDLRDLPGPFEAVIASEILEHLDDRELEESLEIIRAKLVAGGKLLVTTPNGYSLFELENLLWYRTGVDRLYGRLRSGRFARRLRRLKAQRADWSDQPEPMTLADSPHKQRFTWRSIHETLSRSGFEVVEARGAILFCGPFSDVALSGLPRVMALNKRLGRRFPRVASDFYLAAVKRCRALWPRTTRFQPRRSPVRCASGPAICRSYSVASLSIRSPVTSANIARSSRFVYAFVPSLSMCRASTVERLRHGRPARSACRTQKPYATHECRA